MTTDLHPTDRDAEGDRDDGPDGPDATASTGAGDRPATGGSSLPAAAGRRSTARPAIGTATRRRPTTSPGRQRLPWILAALGLLGTLGFGLAWAGADDGSTSSGPATGRGPGAPVVEAATAFSVALTNFDGATIDRDFDKIVALSTGEFRGQADGFFSSKVRTQLKEAQASSRGEVRSAYVQRVDGSRASVFVVLDQTIANNSSPQPQADTLRMDLGLVRTGGRWLVSSVDVLQAPSGGSTIGTPGGDAGAAEPTGGG